MHKDEHNYAKEMHQQGYSQGNIKDPTWWQLVQELTPSLCVCARVFELGKKGDILQNLFGQLLDYQFFLLQSNLNLW